MTLYSIAPHAPFLATLADRILDGTLLAGWERKGPFWLSDVTIILPTSRARLALADQFAARGVGLLPDMRTLGGDWTIRAGVSDGVFLTRDLGRSRGPIDLPTKSDLQQALDDPVYDVAPWNSTSPRGFRNKLEGWGRGRDSWRNHNRVHRWVGGHMVGGASVNDPVFWLVHAFIDLQWQRWQQRHRKHRYLPARPPGKDSDQYRRIVARHQKLPPWDVTPDDLEDVSKIYRYA